MKDSNHLLISKLTFAIVYFLFSSFFSGVYYVQAQDQQENNEIVKQDWFKGKIKFLLKYPKQFSSRYRKDQNFRNRVQKWIVQTAQKAYFERNNGKSFRHKLYLKAIPRDIILDGVIPEIDEDGKLHGLLTDPKTLGFVQRFELDDTNSKTPWFGFYRDYLERNGFEGSGSKALIKYMMQRNIFAAGYHLLVAHENAKENVAAKQEEKLTMVRRILSTIFLKQNKIKLRKNKKVGFLKNLKSLKVCDTWWIRHFSKEVESQFPELK